MEKYNLDDLMFKINNKITNLEVKDNPSFQDVLESIKNKIKNGVDLTNAELKEDVNNINLKLVKQFKEFSFNLTTDEQIRCVSILKQKADREEIDDYYQIDEMHIREMIAKVDENSNLVLEEHFSLVDNDGCKENEVNNFTTSERKIYNSKGIMIEREFKSFGEEKIERNINNIGLDEALLVPRLSFDKNSNIYDTYIEKNHLVRNMLDTAKLSYKDKLNNREYKTVVKLNEYNGLRNMTLIGYQDYPEDIVITPLSKFEIEQKIIRESNLKVQEGLKEFSKDRENYNYNASYDNDFLKTGFDEIKTYK
jgi:hypothetical protein